MAEPEERFLCAPGLNLEAHRRLTELQFEQVAAAMLRLEAAMERLEKRLWLTVFAVVGVILGDAVLPLLSAGT
ncbi:GTA head formation protein, RCAP_rcc01685 family [Wenxinia saemankumensis]|uniref:Uncharacterized protein n=1 Tax=Wenxinia saemankumensis TaxID=1447782 RepID=A0A1M6GM73_9RHOB|nr:hypothetical protein [Wenxinia saemankumensis]SHJ11047.1 hypothetical protein SAMN05444417_2809 [Wenxinia saemankumensis]